MQTSHNTKLYCGVAFRETDIPVDVGGIFDDLGVQQGLYECIILADVGVIGRRTRQGPAPPDHRAVAGIAGIVAKPVGRVCT